MISVIHKIVTPSVHLLPYVKDYTYFDFSCSLCSEIPIKPFPANTEHCLVFYLRGHVKAIDPQTNATSVFPKIALNGSQISRYNFKISNPFRLFSVQFQPGVLSKFLRCHLPEFTDQRIDAEAIFNSDISFTHQKMVEADTIEKVIRVIEEYLWKRINSTKIVFHPIDSIIRIVSEDQYPVPIEKMASESCLSVRQFERRFIQSTGILPKLFIRINRFHRAFKMKDQHPEKDWLSIALHTGYYDYQHLVKDFKKFSYTTPKSLLQAHANAPEKFA